MLDLVSDNPNPNSGAALERLRTCTAGCELVLLADVSTGTVLAWNGAVRYPQEHLDGLCAIAADLLGPGQGPASRTAVLALETGCQTFVRAPDNAEEVLCCVLAVSGDVAGALEASRAFLSGAAPCDEPCDDRADTTTVI